MAEFSTSKRIPQKPKSAAFLNAEKAMMANKVIILRQQIMYKLFDAAIIMTEDEEQRRVLKNKIKDVCQRSENNLFNKLQFDETDWTLKKLLEEVSSEFTFTFVGNLHTSLSLFFLEKDELRNIFYTEAEEAITAELVTFQEEFVDFLKNE